MTNKTALRAQLRARRDAFVAGDAPALPVPPEFIARLSRGMTIASYIAVGSEADPAPLASAALHAGCRLALPHVTVRSEPMRFLAWDGKASLAAGPYGLRQPDAAAAELRPDIILTPLLGFDAKRDRLGQGAGYYDQAFAAFPDAWRVGVAFSVQQVETLPTEAWDVPLHAIVTERGWLA